MRSREYGPSECMVDGAWLEIGTERRSGEASSASPLD